MRAPWQTQTEDIRREADPPAAHLPAPAWPSGQLLNGSNLQAKADEGQTCPHQGRQAEAHQLMERIASAATAHEQECGLRQLADWIHASDLLDQQLAAGIITRLAANGHFAMAVAQHLDALRLLEGLVIAGPAGLEKGSLDAAVAVTLILAALNSRIDFVSLHVCHTASLQCLLAALSDDAPGPDQPQLASVLAYAIQHQACQREVVKQGGVPVLIKLLGSASARVSASSVTAILALTRLPEGCTELLQKDALPAMLALLNKPVTGLEELKFQLLFSKWAQAVEALCRLAALNADSSMQQAWGDPLDDMLTLACLAFFRMMPQQLQNHSTSGNMPSSSTLSGSLQNSSLEPMANHSSLLFLLDLLASPCALAQAQAAMWIGCLALNYSGEATSSMHHHMTVMAVAEPQLQELQHSAHPNVRQAAQAALGLFAEKVCDHWHASRIFLPACCLHADHLRIPRRILSAPCHMLSCNCNVYINVYALQESLYSLKKRMT